MKEEKVNFDQLSHEELATVTGGIPYEKPMFILLDDSATKTCDTGMLCTNGGASGNCLSGTECKKGVKTDMSEQ